MSLELSSKAALVTGASQGMGFAVAKRLCELQAAVAISSRSIERISDAANQIGSATGETPNSFECDLSDGAQVQEMVDQAAHKLGGLDILVSNVAGPPRMAFMQIGDETWQQWFDTTFMSFVRLTRAAVPHMRERGGGHIVTIGSNSSVHPIENFSLSNAFRPAVAALVKSLAAELAPYNIRVTTISPGRILTDRLENNLRKLSDERSVPLDHVLKNMTSNIPLQRFGRAEEIADLIAFIVSDQASYLTGTNIILDGGLTSQPRPS